MENYYELLGIVSSATKDEIERALRRAAEQQALDLDEIKQCREYLLNPAKKAEYDKELHAEYPELAKEDGKKVKAEEKLRKKNQKGKGSDFLELIGMGVVVSIPFLWFTFSSGGSSKPSGHQAQSACERAVTGILKSPSSADFGGWQRRENADGTYEISGYVDSQNSFGAVLRAQFSCSVDSSGNRAKITYFR